MKLRQVDYGGELAYKDRERVRYCGLGERERTEMRRENSVGFKRGQHWLILTNGLNQHMGILGYRK